MDLEPEHNLWLGVSRMLVGTETKTTKASRDPELFQSLANNYLPNGIARNKYVICNEVNVRTIETV